MSTRSSPQLRNLRKKSLRTGNKMAIKDKSNGEPLDWNVDVEVQLFYAMRGHKPVGVNRHFQMACILEKFRNSIQKDISSQQIWDHLETMYDMDALHESEILPFPNEEVDFILPEIEFGQLMKHDTKEIKVKEEKSKEDKEVKEEKEKPTKVSKSKQQQQQQNTDSHEEKEIKHSPAKSTIKDKHKEIKEADSVENSPKRKRSIRNVHQEHSSKPSSPATKEPTPKRRRT